MPIEVIDLLSSPELPKATSSRQCTKENLPAITKTALPKKALTYEPPKRGKDGWFSLSSDSEVEVIGKSNKSAFNASSKPTEKPKPNISAPNKPIQSLPVSNYSAGVYFNSDDFDSTVNLDDSYALDVPPAKKRRLSSSPELLEPRTKPPRTSGFQRSVSNAESTLYKPGSYRGNSTSLQRSKTFSTVLESDPIVFTSSPDPFQDAARRRRERQRKEVMESSDEDDIFGLKPSSKGKAEMTFTSDEDDIFGLEPSSKGKTQKKFTSYDISDHSSDIELPDLKEIVGKGAPNKSRAKSSQSVVDSYYAEKAKEKKSKEAAQKASERQVQKASKDAEKERKRLEREEKASEKERSAEIARVNVVKTSKQRSSHEMMVEIPSNLSDSALGAQVSKLLDKAEIKHSTWESALPVVKWKREVSSDYNEQTEQWEPVPTRIEAEKHIILVMTAKEFVELATGEEGEDIDSHVLILKAKFPSGKIICLIEGLTPWMRKNRSIQNRKYTETVRNQGQEEPTASQRSKKKKQEEYIDEDLIEDALLRLQVMHGALIHHSAAMVETAEWILVFTQHISTVPYR